MYTDTQTQAHRQTDTHTDTHTGKEVMHLFDQYRSVNLMTDTTGLYLLDLLFIGEEKKVLLLISC